MTRSMILNNVNHTLKKYLELVFELMTSTLKHRLLNYLTKKKQDSY